MSTQYDNAYAENNVYGHTVELLKSISRSSGSIHIDFGCGFGRMAEFIRDDLGVRYIGVDIDEEALLSLKGRGFDVMYIDLTDPASAKSQLKSFMPDDGTVQSMSILDTLEHLSEPAKTLSALHDMANEYRCPLVISVPNFGHADIGYRLSTGRFEYTESGLLDHTHRTYFTESTLGIFMKAGGFHEVARNDVLAMKSDQAFPKELASVASGTPLNQFLQAIRKNADPYLYVNQFVRMYLPGPQGVTPGTIDSNLYSREDEEFFLTVVTRTQGRRIRELKETLLCLLAQEVQDFHVLIMGHDLDIDRQLLVEKCISDLPVSFQSRVELVRVESGKRAKPLNEAFRLARGRYIAMLDDDDIIFGHWTKEFKRLANEAPGKLLRTVCVTQQWKRIGKDGSAAVVATGRFESPYPSSFDLIDHLVENRSPLHSLAFPKSLYRDLGFRFDEGLSTAEDWDFIVRVAPIAGVASSDEVTCVYRRWDNGDHSAAAHSQEEWDLNYRITLGKLDSAPLLLPPGTTKRLRSMAQELDRLKQEIRRISNAPVRPDVLVDDDESRYIEALRWRLHTLLNSPSWKLTAPLRVLRRLLGGGGSLSVDSIQLWRLTPRDLEYLIGQIENSRSMRVTRPLRRLAGGA